MQENGHKKFIVIRRYVGILERKIGDHDYHAPCSTQARPGDTESRLKQLAEARKRTPHWLMRKAIGQYVEREKKREALQQDAVEAWSEYRESGLHATGDEIVTWLATWGMDNETTPPECHE